ncbi:MAG: hypothetical protein M5R36_01810 [Deltaproteobacteria bacterium]|nr:hypothetical protein [Deltaproteobacteria bacterium]
MRARRDIHIGVWALTALNLVVVFAVIGLLTRMAPAIENIIEENVQSLEAGEAMLGVVAALRGGPADDELIRRFHRAFEIVRANVTEAEEPSVIEEIAAAKNAALGGEPAAVIRVIENIRRLGEINRDAMHRADERAKRIGTAGAWAAVFMGSVSFWASLVVLSRLGRRVAAPLEELHDTLDDIRRGNTRRRIRPMKAHPELRRVLDDVDELLDHRFRSRDRGAAAVDRRDRVVLLSLLDEREHPVFLVDADGNIHAANKAGLARLDADDGGEMRAILRIIPGGAADVPEIRTRRFEEIDLWLCEWPAA